MDGKKWLQAFTELAKQIGFDNVAASPIDPLPEASARLRQWLAKGMHGDMDYMQEHAAIREHPEELLPGAKSIISLTYNYYKPVSTAACGYSIARYAWSRDYHKVLRKKLKTVMSEMESCFGTVDYRICVDSAPIMEKAYAQRAGLGWIGKNGCFIAPNKGSYFLLAEVLVDIELPSGAPATDHCGECRICMDKCPTGAIVEPCVVDARKCISYLTIESKGDIPDEFRGKYRGWIFGCDICQEVCPHNRFASFHDDEDFTPHEEILSMCRDEWRALTKGRFDELFEGMPQKRAKYEGFMRNIKFVDNK
ncbi:MAG: tRNA epoxyqueuosine(34) reductase QueG [Candidatus Zixiibacteriota bacterium]